MGRGLSPLQRTILRLAYKNYVAENRQRDDSEERARHVKTMMSQLGSPGSETYRTVKMLSSGKSGADVYFAEVLVEYYGWTPSSPYALKDRDGRRVPGGKKFIPEEIGDNTYHTAHAAVSRAALRLEQRGLVTRMCGAYAKWAGVNLTPAGISIAKQL
jgi:hypothetical protein